jgi:hypothetical protein
VTSIVLVAKQIAVSHEEKTVLIELICSDAYAAVVLYDDVLSRLNSESGLKLTVRCGPALNDGEPR